MRIVDPVWLLEELGIEYSQRGKYLWCRCPHPDHNDSSPSWRIIADESDERFGQHRCYGCQWGGWPVHLVEAVNGIDRGEAWEWIEANGNSGELPSEVEVVMKHYPLTHQLHLKLPEGVVLASEEDPYEWPNPVKRYLHSRGITAEQARKWDIGYAIEGDYHHRIVLPIRNEYGELLSYTGRTYNKAPLRYREPKLEEGADVAAVFGPANWGQAEDVVVVTEGGFNALAVERVIPSSWRVAALYGSNLYPAHLLTLSRFQTVLLATDADGAGNKVSAELAEELGGSANMARVKFPPRVDCNDMTPQALRNVLDKAYDSVTVGARI